MPQYINFIIIIAITLVLLKTSDFVFKYIFKGQRIHIKFLKGLIKALILLIGIIVIGGQFNTTKDLASVLIQNTAFLVAVLGFAAQQTLNDILSGLMLSWYKPFDMGSRIHLVSQNITGLVEDITLRHTVIRSFDNNRVIIPNSIINKEILKNYDYEDSVIGNFLEVEVSSDSDIHQAIQVLDEVIRENPAVLTTDTYSPGVLVKDLRKNGYVLKATIWTKTVDDNFSASSEIRIKIQEQFREKGINLI